MKRLLETRQQHFVFGTVKTGKSTKQLLRRLEPKQIALIQHEDLDEIAAEALVEAKVKAVINAASTMTGRYPTMGPLLLLNAGIPIYEIDPDHFGCFRDQAHVSISPNRIQSDGRSVPCRPFTKRHWNALYRKGEENLGTELSRFIDNTLHYAKKEKHFFIHPLPVPDLRTKFASRHAVVVARGSGYKKDLKALKAYIEDYRPVLIGVDGGADALIENGLMPELIVGDMDSISDRALKCGAEIVVHAYPDGKAPGMDRVLKLGLTAKTVMGPGTSEDMAMLIAYEKGAELIVTLGTHTHMIDFLEKGRKGMASSILVRMKIGSKILDAKGVSKIYQRRLKWRNLWAVPAACCFPLYALGFIHPGIKHFFHVLWLSIKFSFF